MRRIAIGLGITLAVVVAIVALAITFRVRLVSAAVRYGLGSAGFADARFTVERVDRRMIVLSQIDCGTALRAERCELFLDWRHLPHLPVDRVRIVGARIDLARPAPPVAAAARDESGGPPALPIAVLPALELDDAVVTFAAPSGPARVQVDSRVETEDGALRMRLRGKASGKGLDSAFAGEARLGTGGEVWISVKSTSLDVQENGLSIAGGAATATLTGNAVGLALHDARVLVEASARECGVRGRTIGAVRFRLPAKLERGGGTWTVDVEGAELWLDGEAVHASGIDGTLSANSAKLAVRAVEDTSASPRFGAMSADFQIARGDPTVEFSADVRAARGRATAHAEGVYDRSRGIALADVTLPKTTLGARGVRLAELSRRLASADASGDVAAVVHLRWNATAGLTGDARVALADVSASTRQIRIAGVGGSVELVQLFPPLTSGVEQLRAREIHPGVPFSNASLDFALEPAKPAHGSRLRIARFETEFAGGRISVPETVIDPVAATNAIEFRVTDVDVAALFALAGVDGFTGTGRLSGSIPVAVRGRAVAIPRGNLVASGGVVQIRSEKIAAALAGGGKPVDAMVDALRDFHYEELSVEITKTFDGETSAALHLSGANPAVLEGQPFRINLNLSGNLDRLAASLIEVARLSDEAIRATVRAVRPLAAAPAAEEPR